MWSHLACLTLLLSVAFGVVDTILSLKGGPLIDAEGREFKTATLGTDGGNLSGPQLDGGSVLRVQCTETSMIIVVKADLYDNGHPLSPGEVFLGDDVELPRSSQCRAVGVGDTEYVIEAELQSCGSKLTISEDSVIYSNKLVISPAAGYHGIIRKTRAVVHVSCHYKRTHFVSSNVQEQPALNLPASPTKHSFSLKLLRDDWKREAFSPLFYLGDLLHLEASYTGPGHRLLFIDSCVATLSPNTTSLPRYNFISNHGCLNDAKEGGSNSLFRRRRRPDSLQLQLNAFLFHQDSRNSIFITCQMKSTSEMWKSSPTNKACNYIETRWENVDGNDMVCRCCDGTCSPKRNIKTNLSGRVHEDVMACGSVTLGPLMIFHRK